MEIFAISALINALVATALGLFVISYDPKNKVNRLYFLLGLAVAFWSAGYWQWQLSASETSALFWVRLLSIGSTLIPVFYFHWVAALLDKDKKQKKIILFTYILAFIILLFSFSPLFIKGVRPKMSFQFWPDPGIFYHIYLAYVYCILVVYSIVLLLKDYKISSGERRAQIIYVVIGSVVGFGGGLFNFFLWYDIPILPYGNFLVALYPFFLGYAVIKYRLFDVKIVVTEVLVFLLWIFLLVKTLLSSTSQDLLINGGILVAVAFIGVLLIRGILNDVKQKEQIENMAEDVKRAYEVEKKAHLELERLDKLKNQFMMTVQHHLKTPLTAMMGYSDLLLKGTFGKQNKETTEVVQRFQDSTVGLIKMVNDLLDVTQFQMGKGVVSLKPGVDIVLLVEQIIKELKFPAEQRGLYLKFFKAGEIPQIKADAEKLRASLFNIFDNGLKYTKEGGLTIKMKSENGKVKIESKDSGIGMSTERLEKLFNSAFDRSDDAKKTNTTGRGVGLYLSSEIIKLHNGKLWATSEGEGKGSTFFIELPIG